MPIRLFTTAIAACLIASASAVVTSVPASAYQERTCRQSCLAAQFATIKRCRSQCYHDFDGARRYCYDLCVGRGH